MTGTIADLNHSSTSTSIKFIASISLLLLFSEEIYAKPILITWGDVISHVGDITQERKQEAQIATNTASPSVGYHYYHIGVFWLSVWTWGGEYCIYDAGDKSHYWSLTPAEAGYFLNNDTIEASPPWWYRIPVGLVLVVGFIAVPSAWSALHHRKANTQLEPSEDGSETSALEMSKADTRHIPTDASPAEISRSSDHRIDNHSRPPLPAGFLYDEAVKRVLATRHYGMDKSDNRGRTKVDLQPGVDYLVAHGIDQATARTRLLSAVREANRRQNKG